MPHATGRSNLQSLGRDTIRLEDGNSGILFKGNQKHSQMRVPLYRQTTDFTCGASATLMVWRYFDKKVKLSKRTEFLIWTDIMALPFKFSSPYRIAIFFIKKGFETKLITKEASGDCGSPIECYRVDPSEKKLFIDFFKAHSDILKRHIGSSILDRRPTIADIKNALSARSPVILLVDSYCTMRVRGVRNPPHAPHWIVVIGFEGKKFHINDSIDEKHLKPGRITMTGHVLGKAMDTYPQFGWASALIVVGKKKTPR